MRVEVTEKVRTCKNVMGDYTRDDEFVALVHELEKKLAEIGLRSTDLTLTNVGILLKDNKINYSSINFEVGSADSTSIENNNNFRVRKKGEYVLIDLDDLEIIDINKYINYLRNIGINEKTIESILSKNIENRRRV